LSLADAPRPGRASAWAFWACAVVVLVLMTAPVGDSLPRTGWDKLDHVCAFALLSLLGLRAYASRAGAVALGLIAYGVLTEGIQGVLPYREADWRDLVANTVGILLAALVWGLWLRRKAAG
jgi:VanZ family protein